MTKFKKYLIVLFCLVALENCNLKNQEDDKLFDQSLSLKINFSPAFDERSEIELLKTETEQFIQILIRNNFRADKTEDTFWFKKVRLTNKEFLKIDSSLVNLCRKKIPIKHDVIVDGITVSSILMFKQDTNNIYFRSPLKITDSIGYDFTISVCEILKSAFNDTIVDEYFYDVESYIDESKHRKLEANSKIDQLRMKKYNWSIR